MTIKIDKSWEPFFSEEFEKSYFNKLIQFLDKEYQLKSGSIFPEKKDIFNAFNLCPVENIKVVIIGQDPYPTKGHAHGLCFSVSEKVNKLPKSLQNIFKELSSDLGGYEFENGNLEHWAKQGVLLLNSSLTVEEGKPESHSNKGWEQFTDSIIYKLNKNHKNIVYILWGSKAISKAKNVSSLTNCVLTAPHPSPLSAYRGFFGCKHFSKTNNYLKSIGQEIIQW